MKTYLLADVGGTNARFALARSGRLVSHSIARFDNDAFDGFAGVLATYLKRLDGTEISACCVGLAGQVDGDSGRLTNRPWTITSQEIARQTGCQEVALVNDLYALGRSVSRLAKDDLQWLTAPLEGGGGNGQALVVNIGTGFNIAFVMRKAGVEMCSASEAGHMSLPISVARYLRTLIGEEGAGGFPTIEHCFSGRGLSAVHAAASGGEILAGQDIFAQARAQGPGHQAHRTARAYARMLGVLLTDLARVFLPGRGIYLVGGVAQGLVDNGFAAEVLSEVKPQIGQVSIKAPAVALISKDLAPLIGGLSVLDGAR